MDDKEKKDNVAFIFDDPNTKKPGTEIQVDCPDCPSKLAMVLYATQQPFYEDADDPVDVANFLFIRCKGNRCDLIGIVEQKDRNRFERIFPQNEEST